MKHKFAAAVNCIDGRVQQPLLYFMKNRFEVDFVDMITEAGPDKILSERGHETTVDSIKERVRISVEKHGSKTIIIAGHYDCANNPVDFEEHCRQIKESVRNIESWGFDAEVYGVWTDENWTPILL